MMNMKVNIAGVELNNPIITASGSYGFGREYGELYSLNELGAICVKGLTLAPRAGNPPPRITETYGGILNSVGLQNPGVDAFIKYELPELKQYTCKVIANIAGNTVEDYCQMAEKLSDSDVDMLEMNISCPNVKEGGVAFGTNANTILHITQEVKKHTNKPLIVKLSPNVTDITEMAKAAEQGGADALSLINTLLGMAIDIKTRRPILANVTGGLSGPAVKPVAVRMVYQVAQVTNLPIIGMGGITTGEDAVEFMLAGSCAVAVGTANFMNPYACVDIKKGIIDYMEQNKIDDVGDLVGKVIIK
ncbi:MAG: dihydroorotate dehydrogenase [Clostridia bacterium]|nr:dihydroorotate dehydrogenase [Clostridia bacterium]